MSALPFEIPERTTLAEPPIFERVGRNFVRAKAALDAHLIEEYGPLRVEELGEPMAGQIKRYYENAERWTWIYFIQDADGAIKIGVAQDAEVRLKNLQVAHARELTLLGKHLAPKGIEKLLHEYLKEYRIRGEWFRGDPFVRDLVDAFRTLVVVEEEAVEDEID